MGNKPLFKLLAAYFRFSLKADFTNTFIRELITIPIHKKPASNQRAFSDVRLSAQMTR
jgi:hypothetical protein